MLLASLGVFGALVACIWLLLRQQLRLRQQIRDEKQVQFEGSINVLRRMDVPPSAAWPAKKEGRCD